MDGCYTNNDEGILYVPSIIWQELYGVKREEKNINIMCILFFQEILKDQNGYPGSKPPWGKHNCDQLK